MLPDKVEFPRSLVNHQEEIRDIKLHAFGDASGKGVSAVVFAVIEQPSGVSQGLVAAKSRLAKQQLTIPRQELVSAHMACNLVHNVKQALEGFSVSVWLARQHSSLTLVERRWRIQTVCSKSSSKDRGEGIHPVAICEYQGEPSRFGQSRSRSTGYIKSLRERHNLKHKRKEIKLNLGDVVMIRGEERNRGLWRIGIVEKLIQSRDKVVRGVRLRVGKSYLERPVQHLFPLELSCDMPSKSKEKAVLDVHAPEFHPKRREALAARELFRVIAEEELEDEKYS